MSSAHTSPLLVPQFTKIFITVGTTEFVQLIDSIDNEDFLVALSSLHCHELTIQFGRGNFPTSLPKLCDQRGIRFTSYNFKPDLKADMESAHLIISHCGAGSILESINLRKPLIVVVNESLQGNHQHELSDALANDGHCLSTTPNNLIATLKLISSGEVTLESFTHPFPEADLNLFPAIVDDLFGFAGGKR